MNAQTKKTVIVVSGSMGVLAVMLAVYFLVFFRKGKNTSSGKGSGSGDFPLSRSTVYSGAVRELQDRLNDKLEAAAATYVADLPKDDSGNVIAELAEDGYFGPLTQRVVRWYFGTETVTEKQFDSLA